MNDRSPVSFGEAFAVWVKIGLLSFGGPAGQIALMHRMLVDEKKWLSESQFLHALNFCMLLPGPEAQQLATYSGWLLHGVKGGLAAGLMFILPGIAVMMALAMLYAAYADLALVEALFFGIKTAVFAIVIEALVRIAKRAMKQGVLYAVAGAAFVAIFLFDVPFPLVIAGAAFLVGASVSVAGAIGFVGIAAPHLARALAGQNPARILLPSIMLGGAMLAGADLFIRMLPFDQELKLGVAAALIGAPGFVWIAATSKRIAS